MRHLHIPGVRVKAQFSSCRKYRYRLEVVRDSAVEGKTACVIMMNPSFANEEVADKSVQFMEKVVLARGLPEFEGVRRLIVVNQFAFIQTHKFKGLPHEIGPRNNAAIRAAFAESDIIIVGWGCANPFEERKKFVLDLLTRLKGKRFYKTKKHPSRAGYEGFIQPLRGNELK